MRRRVCLPPLALALAALAALTTAALEPVLVADATVAPVRASVADAADADRGSLPAYLDPSLVPDHDSPVHIDTSPMASTAPWPVDGPSRVASAPAP